LEHISEYTDNYRYFAGYTLTGDGYDQNLLQEVVENVKGFDKVIIMTGLPESYEFEGADRKNIDLPAGHLRLIDEVTQINPNVIVTLYIGSQVAMPFASKVKGIVNCNLLGAASGRPFLDILFGKISPSGRLATTFPLRIEDDPSTANFANTNNAVWYVESIFVGYRYYTSFKKEVLFPFGYGLSYSTFAYRDLEVEQNTIEPSGKINVRVKVKNIGTFPAKEVVQLYVENNVSAVYKPLRELRRFKKVFLNVDEEKEVEFVLNYEDFSYYDVQLMKFHVNKGIYKIQICRNAEEVTLEKSVERAENENGYQDPVKTEYKLTDQDFSEIYNKLLPERNLQRRRPFTLNDNFNDVEKTFIGKIAKKMLVREFKKKNRDKSPEDIKWMVAYASEIPFRSLATMSSGIVTIEKMQDVLDIINLKFFRRKKKR
ncbi:MAG: hypothetical protein GX661_01535, partial [Acholeplasmataceae bacterium]|nr:hypothetical protein [Acholeplasmataceae bacterium]